MTVSIGSVTLSDSLDIEGDINSKSIRSTVTHTFGGGHVRKSPSLFGKIYTIMTRQASGGFYGKFTREQSVAIAAIREAGTEVSVTHPKTGTFNAIVTETKLQAWASSACANPDADQLMEGSVTVMRTT